MKQYVDLYTPYGDSSSYEEGTKKVPLPAAYHLNQAVGALTLHTGRNYTETVMAQKRPTASWRTSSPDSNGKRCKVRYFFSNTQTFAAKSWILFSRQCGRGNGSRCAPIPVGQARFGFDSSLFSYETIFQQYGGKEKRPPHPLLKDSSNSEEKVNLG